MMLSEKANQYHCIDITITTIKIKLIIPSVGEYVEQLKHSHCCWE